MYPKDDSEVEPQELMGAQKQMLENQGEIEIKSNSNFNDIHTQVIR